MQGKGEIEFPFDIASFIQKAEQMEKSVTNISKRMNNFGKTMKNSVTKGIMGATAKIGLLVGAFKSVMKNIPEIGQTFSIASEIMMKEFFFPIRQMLMPYLQKILDWTRDHRAMFAKWGQSVAQVVKTVIDVGKELWKVFKDVASILVDSLQKGLGTSFKSIEEFINVLSVKISIITILLGDVVSGLFEIISPTFEYIIETGAKVLSFFGDLLGSWLELNENGDSLGTVFTKLYDVFDKIVHVIGDSLVGFIEGLFDPLKKIMTPLDNVAESFQRLLNIFGDDNDGIKGAFKWLGEFTGGVILVAFEELAWAIDTVVTGIITLAKSGSVLKDVFTGDWDSLKKDAQYIEDVWSTYMGRTSATGSRQINAMVGAVTGGTMSTNNENPQSGKSLKMKFGDEKLARSYDYIGKIGKYDAWSNKLGTVLPTKDGSSYYRYRNDNTEEMKILEAIRNGDYTSMHDGFISKDGQIVKLDPEDNIYAFKRSPIGNNISAPMTMTFNVTVTEGNAQIAGQNLGIAIQQSFVERLQKQQMAGGF